MNPTTCLAGACLFFIVIPSAILLFNSFQSLQPIEYGLNFNAITMSVEEKTYSTAGLYFLGFGHWFIRFPRVIQTIEFVANHGDLLHTRTSDGLPLTLGLSFQYRYIPEHLHVLYMTYRNEHQAVYVNTATAVIANAACNYSAYTFFNDKQGIASDMQARLSRIFRERLYANVEALQITQVELPSSFQDAILESIATKQNITRSRRYKDNMQVTFQTDRMVAAQVKNQTIILARGKANMLLEQARANARMTEQTVLAEMNAYGNVTQLLGLSKNDSLNYLWWDTQQSIAVAGGARGKEFLVGLDPAAYIRGGGGKAM